MAEPQVSLAVYRFHALEGGPTSKAEIMTSAIFVAHLNKTYASGFQALKDINLEIRHGEIFALLGRNGAGKTTLINVICGIAKPSTGTVTVDGHDILTDYRASRTMIGLVPQ